MPSPTHPRPIRMALLGLLAVALTVAVSTKADATNFGQGFNQGFNQAGCGGVPQFNFTAAPTYRQAVVVDQGFRQPIVVNQGFRQPIVVNRGFRQPIVVNQGFRQPVVGFANTRRTPARNLAFGRRGFSVRF